MRLIDVDAIPKQIGIEPTHGLADVQYWVNFAAIDNAPVVEAIPVDWITKWAKENPANSYSVEKMMKAWEENDG